MKIPRGWMKHPELSNDEHPVIVPDPGYWGARADPPPAVPGWVWLYYVPCDGYRLERSDTIPAYQPDDFMDGGDKAAIWDAVKEAARGQ